MGETDRMINLRKANFQDEQLICIDCGANFTFARGEQYYYASKELVSPPKRCPECRLKRKLTLVPEGVHNDQTT